MSVEAGDGLLLVSRYVWTKSARMPCNFHLGALEGMKAFIQFNREPARERAAYVDFDETYDRCLANDACPMLLLTAVNSAYKRNTGRCRG